MAANTAPVQPGAVTAGETEEHAVLVTLLAPDGVPGFEDVLLRVEQRVRAALATSRAGELEDLEVVAGRVLVYAYGPDADALWTVLDSVIRTCHLPLDRVRLRRGWFGSPCTDLDVAH